MEITVRPADDWLHVWITERQYSFTFSAPNKPDRIAYFDPKWVDDKFIRVALDEVMRDWGLKK